MNGDRFTLLAIGCVDGYTSLVKDLLDDPNFNIDADAFIRRIHCILTIAELNEKDRTKVNPTRGEAIGLVLTKYKDNINAKVIDDAYPILSRAAPTVIPTVLSLFAAKLRPLTINGALISLRLQPSNAAITLITNCADRFNSLAVKHAFIICCKLRRPDVLKGLLDRHQHTIEFPFTTSNPFAQPESFFHGMVEFCKNKDTETTRVFMNKCGLRLAPHVLAASILTGSTEIAKLVFEYRDMLTADHVIKAFDLACKREDLCMMDLLVKLSGDSVLDPDVTSSGFDIVRKSLESAAHSNPPKGLEEDIDDIVKLFLFLGDDLGHSLTPDPIRYSNLVGGLKPHLQSMLPAWMTEQIQEVD